MNPNSILKYLFVFLFISNGFSSLAQAPKKLAADKQRSLKWKPEKGLYYFSHALVYDYENKKAGTKGELIIFLDPVSGTMCFKKESSFGQSGKTFDFIIASQAGKYIYCGTDENGKKIRTSEVVPQVKPDAETKTQQKEEFATYCIPTSNKRQDFGWESIEYDLTYATSDTKDKIWLAQVPFGTYPLYGFELIEGAASLPVSFDYTHLLDSDQLLTESNSADTFLKLKSIEPNPFSANISVYTEVKLE